jgi:hypothetical protein
MSELVKRLREYNQAVARIEVLEEGLKAAVRAANLALFVIRKHGVMPNDSWKTGFESDMEIACLALEPKHRIKELEAQLRADTDLFRRTAARIKELEAALRTIFANTEEGAIQHIAYNGMTAYQALAKDIADTARAALEPEQKNR